MRKVEPTLTDELTQHVGSMPVGKAPAYIINNFRQLVEQVAKLSYLNKDQLLFYRGQTQDFLNKANESTFYPSIYREDNLQRDELNYRFEVLDYSSSQLINLFTEHKIDGQKDLRRKQYIQWSILQHYGVCYTPLLDFTHSLRVACSFAQQSDNKENVYVYVFGLPYITNRITMNSEHDIVTIRLLSICPPSALRPYFQEGYLVGTSDITNEYDSKSELDFNNRLIAKFAIPNTTKFWGNGFSKIPESVLYPKKDNIESLCKNIKTSIQTRMHSGDISEFLTEWIKLEQNILKRARIQKPRPLSVREATRYLLGIESITISQAYRIDELRKYRNILVHEPKPVDSKKLDEQLNKLKELNIDLLSD